MQIIGEDEKHVGFQAACDGNIHLLSMLILDGHCSVNQQDGRGSTLAHKGIISLQKSYAHVVHSIRQWTPEMPPVAA